MALLILQVPLALPLALLTFFAAFIPLIGAPVSLAVATLVALAARGPVIALLVLALIVVIGQIEGHLLHPLVMSRAVNLHPLAVALAVAAGTVLAGVISAVVAVPLVAVAWTVWTTLKTQRSTDGDPDPDAERDFSRVKANSDQSVAGKSPAKPSVHLLEPPRMLLSNRCTSSSGSRHVSTAAASRSSAAPFRQGFPNGCQGIVRQVCGGRSTDRPSAPDREQRNSPPSLASSSKW